jgi:hypothetical protein
MAASQASVVVAVKDSGGVPLIPPSDLDIPAPKQNNLCTDSR